MNRARSAFSLLEVMVAIAILSLGLVLLLQSQARSIELASQAREMTVATMLARGKLYDCQTDLLKKGFSVGDYSESGNFDDEGYPTFYWECHAYEPDMPTPDSADIAQAASGAGMQGAADGAGAQNPGADMGMQFLAPVLSQMSHVMKQSIRELAVIVRWGKGDDRQELLVVTHVIDKGPVNQVAAMIQQQSRALGAATGGAAAPGGGSVPPTTPGSRAPAPMAPGGGR